MFAFPNEVQRVVVEVATNYSAWHTVVVNPAPGATQVTWGDVAAALGDFDLEEGEVFRTLNFEYFGDSFDTNSDPDDNDEDLILDGPLSDTVDEDDDDEEDDEE